MYALWVAEKGGNARIKPKVVNNLKCEFVREGIKVLRAGAGFVFPE
jgi:hypothetical protein